MYASKKISKLILIFIIIFLILQIYLFFLYFDAHKIDYKIKFNYLKTSKF